MTASLATRVTSAVRHVQWDLFENVGFQYNFPQRTPFYATSDMG